MKFLNVVVLIIAFAGVVHSQQPVAMTRGIDRLMGTKAMDRPTDVPSRQQNSQQPVAITKDIDMLMGTKAFDKPTDVPTDQPAQPAQAPEIVIVGGDRGPNGCIGSAGYSWCAAKKKCLRSWEETCEEAGTTNIALPVAIKAEEAKKPALAANLYTLGQPSALPNGVPAKGTVLPAGWRAGQSFLPYNGVNSVPAFSAYNSFGSFGGVRAPFRGSVAPVTSAIPYSTAPIRAAVPISYAPRAAAPISYAPRAAAPISYAPRAAAPISYAPRAAAPMNYAPRAVNYAPMSYAAPMNYAPRAMNYAPMSYAPRAAAPMNYAPRAAVAPVRSAIPYTAAAPIRAAAPMTAVAPIRAAAPMTGYPAYSQYPAYSVSGYSGSPNNPYSYGL